MSTACGIRVKDQTVARTHCALARTATAAFVIDLCGHHTRIDGRLVQGASIVQDGQVLQSGTQMPLGRVDQAGG